MLVKIVFIENETGRNYKAYVPAAHVQKYVEKDGDTITILNIQLVRA